jgi:hypothetical protein
MHYGKFTTQTTKGATFFVVLYYHTNFFMWLVVHDRCWTADRLAKRGLPHPQYCPLWDQEEETINHLLVACIFSRQAWYIVLQKLGLEILAPQPHTFSFEDWWEQVDKAVAAPARKGLNSVIILMAWSIWNHRNRCAFDGQQTTLSALLSAFQEDLHQWELMGLEEWLISSPSTPSDSLA